MKGSDMGNAIAVDNIPIVHCSSRITMDNGMALLESEGVPETLAEIHLITYIDDVVSYMAGFVLKILRKNMSCTVFESLHK